MTPRSTPSVKLAAAAKFRSRLHSCDQYTHINAHVFAKMEHSTAIMEDAAKVVEKSAAAAPDKAQQADDGKPDHYNEERWQNNRKRKADFREGSGRQQHGSRGARGGRNDGKRHQNGGLGRGEYLYVRSLSGNVYYTADPLTQAVTVQINGRKPATPGRSERPTAAMLGLTV